MQSPNSLPTTFLCAFLSLLGTLVGREARNEKDNGIAISGRYTVSQLLWESRALRE